MRYWISIDKKNLGPFTPEEIRRQSAITDDAMVFPEGATAASDWRRLRDVPELVQALRRPAAPPPMPGEPPLPSAISAPRASASPVPHFAAVSGARSVLDRKWIILVAGFLVVSGGGWYLWKRSSPVGITKSYLSHLKANNYAAAYRLLTRESQAYIDFSTFEKFQRKSNARDWEFADVMASTATDHIHVQWTEVSGIKKKLEGNDLVMESGHWRVAHTGSLSELANEAAQRQDFETTITVLKQEKEIAPWDSSIELELAKAYVNRPLKMEPGVSRESALREAVEVARDVAARFPDNFRAQHAKATALRNATLLDEAITSYGRALELAQSPSEKAEALLGRCICRGASNDENGALSDITEAAKLDPENVQIRQIVAELGPALKVYSMLHQ